MTKEYKRVPQIRPISQVAERIDTYTSYKSLVNKFRKADYPTLHGVFKDAVIALQVLIRKEAKGESIGLESIIGRDLIPLAEEYMKEKRQRSGISKRMLQFTYEWLDSREGRP